MLNPIYSTENPCGDLLRLSRSVVDASDEVYRAKTEYDSAKLKRATNVNDLAGDLRGERQAKRIAERAFTEHIRQHGCKA
jgi:hypothetical protein